LISLIMVSTTTFLEAMPAVGKTTPSLSHGARAFYANGTQSLSGAPVDM